ncbi:hypothetical protein [Alteribacter natronophilus]|uniref:hypothetical protein n=1 Tax=Alteribacter natronophilus TaxID=2583810 RepID=UPI00110E16F4|nr:hypothetical protein [Alteribacter natronophilus]TMW71192.1 hypothetical protein FGB90_14640 [Alteribacter natronophilus]
MDIIQAMMRTVDSACMLIYHKPAGEFDESAYDYDRLSLNQYFGGRGMKIFITLLIVASIISFVIGLKKKHRNMTIISGAASVGFLVLYMVLFQL